MNRLPTSPRSVAGRAGHDPPRTFPSTARSRVLIDPDRPDAAHPIMLAPRPTKIWDQRGEGMTDQPTRPAPDRHAPALM